MKKFFNTLFHGNRKTKILLWICIVSILAAIGCVVGFVNTVSMPWIFGTILFLLVPLAIFQKYDFNDADDNRVNAPANQEKSIKAGISVKTGTSVKTDNSVNPDKSQVSASRNDKFPEKRGQGEAEKKTEPGKNVKTDKKSEQDITLKQRETTEEVNAHENAKESQEISKKPEKKNTSSAESTEEERPEQGTAEDRQISERHEEGLKSPDKELREKAKEAHEGVREGQQVAEGLEEVRKKTPETISEKSIRKVMHKYKVKREHRPVLIDSSAKHKISQCPAYMWVKKGTVHFLLLEETPREIWIDLNRASTIEYTKQTGEQSEEYENIRANVTLAQIFGNCLPTYHEEYVNHRRTATKNLYVLGEDIMLTDKSARAAFDLLKARFDLPDTYNLPKDTGSFTREAYKTMILLQDGVISASEYKTRTKKILQDMTEAEISGQEYDRNLREMVSRQLITREYADFYSDARK